MKRAKHKKSHAASRSKTAIMIIAIIALVIIAAFFWLQGDSAALAASVNGKPIAMAELDYQYSLLPDYYRLFVTKQSVLDELINQELLLQAANEQSIVVTDAELEASIDSLLAERQASREQLEQALVQSNVSMAQFKDVMRKQLVIAAYVNRSVAILPPSEEQLRSLYDENKESFSTPEQVTVRHVLVAGATAEAEAKANEILAKAKSGADFCQLAKTYSEDPGSKDSCGEYTFGKGVMVPSFEEASFSMKKNQVELVQSEFGYHVIKKMNSTPASTLSFTEAEPLLVKKYEEQERTRQYAVLLAGLRAKATVLIFYNESVEQNVTAEETPESLAPAVIGEPAEAARDEVALADAPPTVMAPVEGGQAGSDPVARCIADKTTLFGASWSTETGEARALFSDKGVEVDYVECKNADGFTNPVCEKLGVKAYPTWDVGGKVFSGRLSWEDLREAAGC